MSRVVSIQGHVLAKRQGEKEWRPVGLNDTFFIGDQVQVGANSRAGLVLSNDALIRLDQNTTLMFTRMEQTQNFILKLLKGAAHFFSRWPRSLTFVTPFVNGVVEGTEFFVQVDEAQTRIDLFEGRIRVANQYGALQLARGEGIVASAGQAPQSQILIHPRDSVQWALYYPPILALGSDQGTGAFREAIVLGNQGQPVKALERLDATAPEEQDSRFYTYRAGLLLQVGRVNQAREDIQQALKLNAADADALALQAVIAVVQNRKDEALAVAQKAVQSDPQSAAAQIALSYAHQATFRLSEALQDARSAVSLAPDNGTVWARLAELQLSTGELDQGIESARKATAIDPHIAHGYTMLGFAYLTQIKTREAREAFNQAIALDSAAPLPRLGLGLAKIREGELKAGRREIEIAAGLDADNALIRSYLGKAYFDEKRDPADEHQFEIAKRLDPNDPTPWFYDAIRKETLNRPVEALHDLQKSIELNDNRAVYRSRLLLDEDLAARSASLGRIYSDLDFQNLALTEGYKSLSADPTNYSAHRLLADSYAAKPRHEIARVSELLQSQLFQPLNLTPIQARLAESKTGIIEGAGPAGLSFNEFNPLFTRNRFALQASGVRGNNHTWGHEITGSALYDRISGSVSSLHYETDGFRQNNGYAQDLYNIFLQGDLTPRTSLQAEYRYSQSEAGDLSQNFDGLYSADQRDQSDLMIARIGAHHSFSPKFEMVASYMHSDAAYKGKKTNPRAGFPEKTRTDIDGNLYEARADLTRNRFGFTTGFSYMNGDQHKLWTLIPFPNVELPLPGGTSGFFKEKAYVYSNLNLPNHTTLMVGLSAASMKIGSQIESKQLDPKLGLILQPSVDTTLRLAAFRVLSSTFVSAQTVEPTDVAGFCQFFDDLDGSDVKSYGIAVDQKFSKRLFGGVEYMRRDLDVPLFSIGSTTRAVFFKWKEDTRLAYIYWTPNDIMALRAEYQYERFDRRQSPSRLGLVDVETQRVPVSISFFHPKGAFLRVVATYFLQEGEFEGTNSGDIYSDGDTFWTIDAEVAYRLPKRWGMVSVGFKNLLDEEFNYTDTDPANPAVVPGVFAFGKITLSF